MNCLRGIKFCDLKIQNSPNKSLANINEFTVAIKICLISSYLGGPIFTAHMTAAVWMTFDESHDVITH